MRFIDFSIRNPVTVAAVVILLAIFGFLALFAVPIQLTPNIDRPRITVSTVWPGASPQEIEREIIDKQEEQLKSVDGVLKMESTSSESVGNIVLEFPVGVDIDSALIRVSNRLEQVSDYPDNTRKPVLSNVDVRSGAIAWFIFTAAPENQTDVATLFDYVEDEIKPRLERVSGVAKVNVYGGREGELQVVVDPGKMAMRNLSMSELAAALGAENRDYSAGDFDEGKRRYIVRTVGDYRSPVDVANVIVATRGGIPIFVRDVATVQMGFRKAGAFVRYKGRPALAINALRESGANVMEVMAGLRRAVKELDGKVLVPQGLRLRQVYDETEYIDSALGLVKSNIYVGGGLAVFVLLVFLWSLTGTFVVAVSIPISVVATFLVMYLLGRSINVISLAGLAFSVGMVVDNSIVVLENIFRHRQMGKPRRRASLEGATEVWGAVLASTLTTVAVFLPVIFVKDEAGQLFRDIAIAISAAVILSLVVSLSVIPTLTARMLGKGRKLQIPRGVERTEVSRFARTATLVTQMPGLISAVSAWINRTTVRRFATVLLLTAASVVGSWKLLPKMEYLPSGNRNLAMGILLPPPGYNLDELRRIALDIESDLEPLWSVEPDSEQARQLPAGGISSFFYVGLPQQVFMGMVGNEPTRMRELLPLLQRTLGQVPGSIGIAVQPSLFQRGGQSRSINVDVRGPELEPLIGFGSMLLGKVYQEMPGTQARPISSLDLNNPEVRVRPDRRRMADVGLTNRELGFIVDVLVDGAKVTDYRYDGREIDLVLMASKKAFRHGHELAAIEFFTPQGGLVTLGSVADVEFVGGPTQITHLERQRAVRLAVVPPENVPLERAMEDLRRKVMEPLERADRVPRGATISLSGTADDLTRTKNALMGNLVLALAMTYLLMASLFQSWIYPLVILFSVPLASLGGFLGLWAVNRLITYQALDILTMLGFVILIGIVVNNAILIVHQSLNLIRKEGVPPEIAIPEAVRTRVRPIFMSTATSIFGMLPLVLFPGAGSELYRGLGSVVIGGLALSTLFTLVLVPALFSLTVDARRFLERLLGHEFGKGDEEN